MKSVLAFSFANRDFIAGQGSAESEIPRDREFVDRLPVLWDSGWQQDGRFNIRFHIIGAADGGARCRLAERILISPPTGKDT